MLDPKKQADAEQGMALIGKMTPVMVRQLYDGFLAQNFTEQQAMELVKVHLHGLAGGKFQ